MRHNPTTDVSLRRRSTPYDFRVQLICSERSLALYDGTSWKYALAAYWQAVHTFCFLGLSGRLLVSLATDGNPYGAFTTEVDGGKAVSLHVPSGLCTGWAGENWLGANIYKKMIASVPGTLGPVQVSG